MEHLYEFAAYKNYKKIFKQYFIDCEDIDDPDEHIYLWRYDSQINNTIQVLKMFTYHNSEIHDEIGEWNERHTKALLYPDLLAGEMSNAEMYNTYKVSVAAFNIIYESDNFDDVYAHFLMLADSKKYNL